MAAEFQAGVAHPFDQGLLVGEATDALDEVDIAVPIVGHDGTQGRNDRIGIEIVDTAQRRQGDAAEFEAKKTAARLENPPRLGERRIDMRDVPEAEGDAVDIEAAVRKR